MAKNKYKDFVMGLPGKSLSALMKKEAQKRFRFCKLLLWILC